MKRFSLFLLVLVFACASLTTALSCNADDAKTGEDPDVIAWLRASGTIMTVDKDGFVDQALVFHPEKALPYVGKLTRVKLLRITDGTKADWTHLRGLTSLEYLVLIPLKVDAQISITDDDLVNLTGLTNLRQLGMMNTAVTGAGLHHLLPLQKLESLGFIQCSITDAGLESIEKLPKLKILGLHHTQVTGAAVRELQKSRPDLMISVLPKDREN